MKTAFEREQHREKVRHLKSEVNQTKSRLMEILRNLERIDAKQARRLGSIIGRLEHWQNT